MKYIALTFFIFTFSACVPAKKFNSEIYQVNKGLVRKTISFAGRIRAKNSVVIRAPMNSHLVKFYKSLGSEIKRDEVLVTLTEPKNNDRLTSLIDKEGLLREALLKESQLQLKINRNKKEVARMSRLLASGSVAKSESDRAKIAYDLELKEYQIVKSRIKTLNSSINFLKANQQEASKELRSPIAGTITELWADEGKMSKGMTIVKDTILTVIEEPGEYILRSDVTEGDYIALKIGLPVDVTLNHMEDKKLWKGKVKSLAPLAEKSQYGIGRFGVDVLFESHGYNIRTGLQAKGTLVLSEKKQVVRIPRSAMLKVEDNYFVTVPSKNGVKRHPITIALIGDEFVEVTAGLKSNNVIYKSFVE